MREWLGSSALAQYLQGHEWAIPAIQTVHILGIAVIFTAMMTFDLRLLGLAGRSYSLGEVRRLALPPLLPALAVMLVTGLLMVVAEPDRELGSPIFWWKMGILAVVTVITLMAGRRIAGDPAYFDSRPGQARGIGLILLAGWVAIVVAGRWIAYFDVM